MGDPECAWNPAADKRLNGGEAMHGERPGSRLQNRVRGAKVTIDRTITFGVARARLTGRCADGDV